MTPASRLAHDLTRAAATKLRQDLAQIRRCGALLSDEQAWHRPNAHCNSVANLVLHLAGNVRQWIVAGIGGEAFDRDRPAEFAARDAGPLPPLLDALEHAVHRAVGIIEAQTADDLLREFDIQGYRVSGLSAVFHVAEHFSFHTGQIVHITKTLRDVDLSLYDAHGRRIGQQGGRPWRE